MKDWIFHNGILGVLGMQWKRGICLVAATCAVYSMAAGGVLFGPEINPANRHGYYLLTESSWQDAEIEACALHGDLVTINDAAEQAWVFAAFGSWGGTPRSLWTGLNDAEAEGQFVWVSGEPVTYTNWLAGQPDNAYGNESYVHMIGAMGGIPNVVGKWNDLASPGSPFHEFDPICGVVEVDVLKTVLAGPIVNPANGNSYYLLAESPWQVAQAYAQVLSGNLVTISDAGEQDWVVATFGSDGGTFRSLWIGLNDAEAEGQFMWVSGEPVTYTNWLAGQPDNAYGNESYVHMIGAMEGIPDVVGKWNDLASPGSPFHNFDPICGVVEVEGGSVKTESSRWGGIKAMFR